jgi:hypothetical protein
MKREDHHLMGMEDEAREAQKGPVWHRSNRSQIRVVLAIVAAMAFALAIPFIATPERAEAGHLNCGDFFRHSGHTDRARWHHCHDMRTVPGIGSRARVHICGVSGTLHGITVFHDIHANWSRQDHAHDPGGEGC